MSSSLDEIAKARVQVLEEQGLRRQLRRLSPAGPMEVALEGKALINFSSNDYLGLSQAPELVAAMKEGVERYGVGSASSRLVCGTQEAHLALEERLAAFKHTEAAITFSTGYATSVGVISGLMGPEDFIVLDKLSHASLIDGAKLSGATLRVFPHNHLEKLERLLRSIREKHGAKARILVITESVFSMDGDTAPLAEMVKLKQQYDAWLLVDEAHGVGVLGPQGRGYAAALGVAEGIDLHMGTLSKALGLSGGYVATSRAVVELMIHRARSLIYSTAPSPALAFAATAAIDLVASERGQALRDKLQAHRAWLLGQLAPTEMPVEAAIFPLLVGEEHAAQRCSQDMQVAGYLLPAIRYPTVSRGAARLRLTLSALHEFEQIEGLAAELRKRMPQLFR